MKKVGSVISSLFLVLLLFVTPVMSSDYWVEYGRSDDGSVHLYNKKTITKSGGKNIVQVWLKWILSDKDREERIKSRRNSGMSTEGWGKLSHGITFQQIDCNNKKYQILSINDYDTNGRVLFRGDNDKPTWTYIVPGSIGDTLREIVCK